MLTSALLATSNCSSHARTCSTPLMVLTSITSSSSLDSRSFATWNGSKDRTNPSSSSVPITVCSLIWRSSLSVSHLLQFLKHGSRVRIGNVTWSVSLGMRSSHPWNIYRTCCWYTTGCMRWRVGFSLPTLRCMRLPALMMYDWLLFSIASMNSLSQISVV